MKYDFNTIYFAGAFSAIALTLVIFGFLIIWNAEWFIYGWILTVIAVASFVGWISNLTRDKS